MKKPDLRRVTLVVMAILCLYVAFERCRNFYVENIPVGEENACFKVHFPTLKQDFQMRLVVNDWQEKKSLITLKYLPDGNEEWTQTITFAQQRMLNPKKMECL